jgi:ABC-type sugar transport system ATPase subunit
MEGIVKGFGGIVVLDRVDFSVRRGEVHALMGENGAGKSTLMKILAGIYHKDDGRIFVEGREINIKSPNDPIRAGIAFVHQHPNLVPMFDVAHNIFLGQEPLRGRRVDHKKIYAEAGKILAAIGTAISPHALARDLTVAERQELSIARALSFAPRVIAFDEPTAPLSFKEVERLFEVISRLTKNNVTVIYISHRMDEIFRISERITVLRNGKSITTLTTKETTPDEVIHAMLGSDIAFNPKSVYDETGETVLKVEGIVTKNLPQTIDFSLRRGEVLGLFGLVGAGRTEVVRALFGVDRINAGALEVNDRRFGAVSPSLMMRNGVALVPEDRHALGLVMDMTIKENISLANMNSFKLGPFINHARERAAVRGLSHQLSIKSRGINTPVSSLSGGNQQKVVLAKWLHRRPSVLILDEPTVGVDVGAKGEIYNLVNSLAKSGVSVIFISSEPEEIFRVADRILVMYRRRIVGEFQAGATDIKKLMAIATGVQAAS